MSTSNVGLRLAVAGVLSVGTYVGAHAQPAGPETMALEEIVVTAEKREEKLQDVPVAISAYTDKARDIVGIKNIEDFASFTPGLNFASNDRLSIRGVGRLTNALGSDPGVATYNDGFYTSSTTESNKSSLFVERVEFLRGPQGTLYGRNSMGGAINIISKRPTTELSGEVRAQYGTYDQQIIEAAISGPITDSFRARFAGINSTRDEGYFENDAGEDRYRQERRLLELQLEADLGDSATWWLKYSNVEWGSDNSDGSLNSVLIDPYYGVATAGQAAASPFPSGSLVPNAQFLATRAGLSNPAVLDHYKISENTTASGTLEDNHNVVSHLTFDFGSTTLKWVGGWQQSHFTLTNDYDLTSFAGPVASYVSPTSGATIPYATPVIPVYVSEFVDDKRSYSNEINFSSSGDGPHKWIVGLYQFHEEQKNPVSLYAPGHTAQINNPYVRAGAGLAPSATLAAPNVDGRFYFADGAVEVDSYAAFGQLDYALSETWVATIGVRYSKDEKVGDEYHRLIAFNPIAVALGGTGNAAVDVSPTLNQRQLEDEWENVSGKVGIEWSPTDATMLYANYNRGYKSGGFNLGTIIGGADPAAATVDEEILDAVEFGWKTNLTANFQLNGAVFYYQYADAQIPFPQFRNGINVTTFENVDATNYGAELETIWAATDNLTFMLNYSYLNTENTRECRYVSATDYSDCYYDSADPQALAAGANPVGQDAAGNWLQNLDSNQLPQAPKNKAAFNTTYRIDFAPGSLTFSGSYTWQDEATYSLFANPAYRVDDFATADFRILWDDVQDRYTIIAYADNAFDDEGYVGASVTALSQGARRSRSFIAPATYGVEVQYRF
ncbi:iron complex outermembrane receptor protein [Povalibacter uvarum]|uniref:Iron complex outermembrane receptor protein n=1 Tax=Povalibacter uvarum TaxID=732238 RepID=A0A841HL33_9GAMM|nr:TonB-dependent receptor [Povalibacter uvarum]MBB6093453.1 iron complex outermembrane receptor protein [Povalibacter uvarum]